LRANPGVLGTPLSSGWVTACKASSHLQACLQFIKLSCVKPAVILFSLQTGEGCSRLFPCVAKIFFFCICTRTKWLLLWGICLHPAFPLRKQHKSPFQLATRVAVNSAPLQLAVAPIPTMIQQMNKYILSWIRPWGLRKLHLKRQQWRCLGERNYFRPL